MTIRKRYFIGFGSVLLIIASIALFFYLRSSIPQQPLRLVDGVAIVQEMYKVEPVVAPSLIITRTYYKDVNFQIHLSRPTSSDDPIPMIEIFISVNKEHTKSDRPHTVETAASVTDFVLSVDVLPFFRRSIRGGEQAVEELISRLKSSPIEEIDFGAYPRPGETWYKQEASITRGRYVYSYESLTIIYTGVERVRENGPVNRSDKITVTLL